MRRNHLIRLRYTNRGNDAKFRGTSGGGRGANRTRVKRVYKFADERFCNVLLNLQASSLTLLCFYFAGSGCDVLVVWLIG